MLHCCKAEPSRKAVRGLLSALDKLCVLELTCKTALLCKRHRSLAEKGHHWSWRILSKQVNRYSTCQDAKLSSTYQLQLRGGKIWLPGC